MKKYVVRNILTDAICGVFESREEALMWISEYTHEQNEGLSPNQPEYCAPHHFEITEED